MVDFNALLTKAAADPNQMLPGADADAALIAAGDGNPFAAATPAIPSSAELAAIGDSKKLAVSAAASEKKAAMATPFQMAAGRAKDSGTQNMTDVERDMRYMSPVELTRKYGYQATKMISQIGEGNAQFRMDTSADTRPLSDLTYDTISSGLLGLGNAVGGIAALGTGLVSDSGGAAISGALDDANNWVRGTQSETLQGAQRVSEARNELDTRDTTIQHEKDVATDGEVIAGLKRIGRDAFNAIDNGTDSGTTFLDGTAQALGSLLVAGPLAKGIKAGVGALVPEATKRGVGLAAAIDAAAGTKSAARVLAAAPAAAVPAAIGTIEAGGAYQQVAADIMGRDHAQLEQESPMYRELIAGGMSQDEAKSTVASRTGKMAAAITAPLAAATGTLVSKFEGNPLAHGSAKSIAGNLLREPIEETIQGGTSQLAQNFAETQGANDSKSLTEGVGRQAGEGGLYGLGMTAGISAPQLAGKAAKAAGVQTLKAAGLAGAALANKADELQRANEAASPIADKVVAKAAADAQVNAPVASATLNEAVATLPAEAQPAAQSYVDKLMSASTFDAGEVSPRLAPLVEGSTNRVEAIQKLADAVAKLPEGSSDQVHAGLEMYRLLAPYASIVESDSSAIDALPEGSPASGIINEYASLMANIQNTPSVIRAMTLAAQALESNGPITVSEADMQTPAGQESVKDAITAAEFAPNKGDLDTNERILYQVEQGNIQVTPEQKAALQTSVAILRAVRDANNEAVRQGRNGKSEQVTREIGSEEGVKGKSALKHAQDIMSAAKAGNTDLAAGRLAQFGDFVQQQLNKVGALNDHFAAGDPNAAPLKYQALSPNGEFFESTNGLAVDPAKEGSVKFAQTVAAEAKMLGDVYNGLVTAFPDLGGKHIEVTPLDSKLVAPAKDVAATYRGQQAKAAAPAPVADTTKVESPTPAPVKTETAPVKTEAKVEAPAPKVETPPAAKVPEPKVQETSPTPTDTVVDAPAEPVKKGTAAAFPDLVTETFAQTYSLPEEATTRTLGSETPLTVVGNALANSASLTKFVGDKIKGKFTPEISAAYRSLINAAHGLVDQLGSQLDTFLNKNKLGERFLNGEEVNRFIGGKVLNLTEVVDGKVVYNPELVEAASLAGMQWLMSADQFGGTSDVTDLSKLLGIDESIVTETMMTDLNTGMSTTEAKRSLASKILNYWGVAPNADGYIGNVQGIAEGMAAEILNAMEATNAIEVLTFKYGESDGLPTPKTINRIVPFKLLESLPELRAMPDAIEQAVMVKPEDINYIGQIPEVAKMQLRSSMVENTPEQKQAIANEQATPYYVNQEMGGLFQALGVDNLLGMFGAGQLDTDKLNENHAKSLDGVNRGTISAFEHMTGLLSQVENISKADGTPLTETPIHYAFNMTSVGRLQMLGKFNPQANKMVREVILPTRSTLDFSNEVHSANFDIALAQALGIKVHKMSVQDSSDKVNALLEGPLAPAVEQFSNWLKGYKPESMLAPKYAFDSSQVNELKDSFKAAGVPLTPVGLHAIMEYARARDMDDRTAFTTSLYVEADGVTNGPINAMVLFTPGSFTENFLTNTAKGGLFVNRPGETVNSNSAKDKADLYQTSTNHLQDNLENLRAKLASDPKMTQQMNDLFTVMDQFLGGDLRFDDSGNLTLQRGIAKNPLTITIYGAGAEGIAGKMVKAVVDAVYEAMSTKLQTGEGVPPKVGAALNRLISTQVIPGKNNSLFTKRIASDRKGGQIDPRTFTFTKGEVDAMRSNMLHLFVKPMREAIEQTVSPELMQTAEYLRKATQAQSIVLEHAFKAEVDAALAKKAEDPTWKKGDFLTQKELKGIYKKLEHLSPFVKTGTQTFFVAGSQSVDVNQAEFGRGLNDKFQSPAYVYGPADSGVSGIPFLNIGTGDGNMMQIISNMKDAVPGTLKIFDGMHIPLDQLQKGSEQANQAVLESWMGNPLRAVSESFTSFMETANLDLGDAAKEQLVGALFGKKFVGQGVTLEEVTAAMEGLASSLNELQLQIEARHNVLNSVNLSVDQMAGASSPYAHTGTTTLTGTNTADVAVELNNLLNKELTKLRADTATTESIDAGVRDQSSELDSGAFLMNSADLRNLAQALKLPADQAATLNAVVNSPALRDYRVIYGTPDQIAQYVDLPPSTGTVKGVTVPGAKVIYLLNPSSETLVHELVHAATIESVDAFYNDPSFKNNDPMAYDAVRRIEVLQGQFMELGDTMTQVAPSVSQAYENATAAIEGHLAKGDNAAALNEFMAWNLSNRDLINLGKRTKISKMAQIANDVLKAIKSIFFGNKNVPARGQDLFSNLVFNTAMLGNPQTNLSSRLNDVVLFQNGQFGSSDRITAVGDAFSKSIGRYLATPLALGSKPASVVVSDAIMTAYNVGQNFIAHGFDMTPQESSVFNHIVTALATEAKIDPNAMVGAQKLYAHVTKNLSVESFMKNPENPTPADEYHALQQYNVLMGKFGAGVDNAGRSTLLPAFLALATVHDGFREILSKMDLPKGEKKTDGSIDSRLENLGQAAMESLSDRMSGISKSSNVQEAIDALNNRIADLVNDQETFIDQMVAAPGGYIDRANQLVVDGITKLATSVATKATAANARANNRVTRLVTNMAAGVAAVVSEESGQIVSKGVMSAMNRMKGWEPLHTLINDIVGRTSENANVYDMIKGVRSQVQQARQQFREHLPLLISEKFSRKLTDSEWTSLHSGMGKTDLASLVQALGTDGAIEVMGDQAKLTSAIADTEATVSGMDAASFATVQRKAKQLANFMNTGEVGKNLLRNAFSISNLFGERKPQNWSVKGSNYANAIDRLVTLYAMDSLPQTEKAELSNLAKTEQEGLSFALSYLEGQRADELSKATTDVARINGYKGYIPTEIQQGVSMIVADDTQYADLAKKSYTRVADYKVSSLDSDSTSRGYYFAPASARAAYEQGIMQNVRQSSQGVDAATGFSTAQTAGRITDRAFIKQVSKNLNSEIGQNLMPIYDANGNVVALERSLDQNVMDRVKTDNHLAKAIGQWRGRQVEEGTAQVFNNTLVDNLAKMYQKDMAESSSNQSQYVNLNDLASLDPVTRDAVKLFNPETKAYIEQVFGDEFWVRKDMLNDALGYRSASIGDAWTGNSRWSPETQKVVQNIALGIMGNQAYKTLVNAEQTVKNLVTEAKVLIVVKSVVVPAVNAISNIYQLAGRGVPLKSMVKGFPAKTAEVDQYVKSRIRAIELEAEQRANKDPIRARKLASELQSITDSHKRMSIWPLIEAGEFSSVSDAGLTRSEILLSSGKLQSYIEDKIKAMPTPLANFGRYGLITKDTALFAGLQKAVEYSDFLAKAVLYDDLVGRQKLSKKEALGRVTEEFVNYDRLSGRFRGTLEQLGMLWFYNFKIRSVKVALSSIRNNPVHSLLAVMAPAPTMFGTVGLPTEDNLVSKLFSGGLGYSIGPGQGLRAPNLNPWHNLVN